MTKDEEKPHSPMPKDCLVKLVDLQRAELNGRVGITTGQSNGTGEERIKVELYNPMYYPCPVQTRKPHVVAIKPGNLAPLTLKESFDELGMPYVVCRPFESSPDVFGGGVKTLKHPEFFPRPAQLPPHPVSFVTTDPIVREAIHDMFSNGRILVGWYLKQDDRDNTVVFFGFDTDDFDLSHRTSLHNVNLFRTGDMVKNHINSNSFLKEILRMGDYGVLCLTLRLLHHMIRQHGAQLPVRVTDMVARWYNSIIVLVERAVTPHEALDFAIAVYDAKTSIVPDFCYDELMKVAEAARKGGDMELSSRTLQFAADHDAKESK